MEATTTRRLTQQQVVELLREKQGEMTNRAFAQLLGVHESYLSKVYKGEIPIGAILVRGLANAYPELQMGLALFLLGHLEIRKAS